MLRFLSSVAFALLLLSTSIMSGSLPAAADSVHCMINTGVCESNRHATPSTGVPCAVFGEGDRCANPFLQGVVDGQWVGLVIYFSGGNGGATEIAVVTSGRGGNGQLTKALGTIKGIGVSGGMPPDGLEPVFHGGKLWVYNYVHLPGQGHFDITNEAVQQYGFRDKAFVRESRAIVPLNSSDDAIAAALKNALP